MRYFVNKTTGATLELKDEEELSEVLASAFTEVKKQERIDKKEVALIVPKKGKKSDETDENEIE